MRCIQREGLRVAYDTDTMPSVRRWLRRLMAMTLLLVFAIKMIWEDLKVYRRLAIL